MNVTTKKEQMINFCNKVLDEVGIASVRQLFYRLVVAGIIRNNRNEYNYLSKVLVDARDARTVDWTKIADATRGLLGNPMSKDVEEHIKNLPPYREDIWKTQSNYIEVWLEKGALSRVVQKGLEEWDNRVWLQPMRGYPSYTAKIKGLYSSNRFLMRSNIVLLVLSDFDPSGKDIDRELRHFIELHASALSIYRKTDIKFVRVALTKEQVEEYDLPSVPAKTSDPRTARDPDKIQVELDALSPDVLITMVKDAIVDYIDQEAYNKIIKREDEIRTTMDDRLEELSDELTEQFEGEESA